MRKHIASVLVPLILLNLTHCTSFEVVRLEQVIDAQQEQFLEVGTINSTIYQFPPRAYKIENDTLYVTRGLMIVQDSTPVSYRGKIAINEIEYYKLKEQESGIALGIISTLALIAGIVIVSAFIGKIIK